MTQTRSLKSRLRHLSETQGLFRPIGELLRFFLAQKFKLDGFVQRLWIVLRLIRIRIQYGKKLVVLYRGVGIGDIVCTFPLVAEIRKQYPDHRIVYVTNSPSRAFVEKFSGADNAMATSYVLYARPLPQVPGWVATKAHFPRYKGETNDDYAGERTNFVSEMASSFGITLSEPRPVITVDESSAASALRRHGVPESSRPYIGIHLGPTLPVKEYPLESWQELAPRLHGELGATLFRFGSKLHHNFPGAESTRDVDVQFDFTDRLELIETTELISTMDLFIGIDSGLLHIANAVHIPVIGLFGPTDPAIVIPGAKGAGLFSQAMPCIFCQHRNLNLHWSTGCPFDIQCMKLLSVDSILAQARSILETSGFFSTKVT